MVGHQLETPSDPFSVLLSLYFKYLYHLASSAQNEVLPTTWLLLSRSAL